MTNLIISRKGWGAKAPKATVDWEPGDLDGIVVHWFGSPKAASSHAGCDDLLRGVQTTHMAPGGLGVPGGGSDIAYNHGVCPHGKVYELRGFAHQTGANGTTVSNRNFAAVVYMAGTGDGVTKEGFESLTWIMGQWFKKGTAVHAITHGSITGSECPGPVLTPWVHSDKWKPDPKVTAWRVVYTDGDGKEQREKTQHPGLWSTRHPGAFKRGPVKFTRVFGG